MNSTDKHEIHLGQISQVYRNQPVGLIANLVNSVFLIFIHWNVISSTILLGWFGAMVTVTGIRYLLFLRYKRADIILGKASRWEGMFITGVMISGLIWGSAGILLFPPGDLARQIFTAFVLGGMVAGSVGAYSALKKAFLSFSIFAMTPIIISLFLMGGSIHFAMGIMVTLFTVLMIITADRNYKMIRTSLELGLENKNLIDYLTRAKEKAEDLTGKLQFEIIEREKIAEELKRHEEKLEIQVKERTASLVTTNKKLEDTISELQHATEALRESEEKYRILVDTANEAVFIIQDEKIKFFNPEFTRIMGYSADELREISIFEQIHPEDRELIRERYQRRIEGEDVTGSYPFRLKPKDGEERNVSLNAVRTVWDGEPAILCLGRDITDQIKIGEQLQVAQKLKAIGTLAGGIAHDFNNMLMNIQGNISLLKHPLAPDHPDYQMLCSIEETVESGTQLTGQLLGFARGGKYEVQAADINEIIRNTASMFGRTRKEIRVHYKMEERVWTVEVDRGQINRVFLNLFINAGQAMAEGGDLYLQTDNVLLDELIAVSKGVEPGKFIKISVTDTGSGVEKEYLQKIFDPFFTTREVNQGTGLGLSSAYGIIKNHSGIITVYSEVGIGTTFNIYLPATDQKVEKKPKQPIGISMDVGTILLVDDEERIIKPVKRILQAIGYETICASSGEEAIRVYKENQDSIDLVILDMIMPGLGGGRTFDILKEFDPEIKILLSSGYSLNGEAGQILARGCNGFIQKPFTIKDLSQKIAEILSQ